jgi:hypothetical protein
VWLVVLWFMHLRDSIFLRFGCACIRECMDCLVEPRVSWTLVSLYSTCIVFVSHIFYFFRLRTMEVIYVSVMRITLVYVTGFIVDGVMWILDSIIEDFIY